MYNFLGPGPLGGSNLQQMAPTPQTAPRPGVSQFAAAANSPRASSKAPAGMLQIHKVVRTSSGRESSPAAPKAHTDRNYAINPYTGVAKSSEFAAASDRGGDGGRAFKYRAPDTPAVPVVRLVP